ncbi:MAG: energy-dependent translational throttle protein EttA [Sandaracinaceae bacterium]|nr:energy-dependent translational throttle protein EttA [Sandaracinaceae bacterium]
MADYIFTMKGVTKVHPPDKRIVTDLYLSFLPGAKIGVIGPNGMGKSSLLRIMAGEDKSFNGEAWLRPGATVGYVPQEPDIGSNRTVKDVVEEAVAPLKAVLARFEEVSMKFGEVTDDDEMNALLEEQGKLQDRIDAADGWSLDHTLELAMDALRLPPPDEPVDHLSGGEKRRVALCRTLLMKPDLLLLDEPTNHLDAESVAWLEQHLAQYPGTIVAITHDRYFLENVAEWILELDRGEAIPFKGNYTAWLEAKEKRLEIEEKQETARQRKIKAELEWVRASPKARQAKSKARLSAFEALVVEQGKAKRDSNEIFIPPPPERLGDEVIEAVGLAKAFGDRLLYEDLSFRIPRGAIVGIIGPNGAGKTTLFNIITGKLQADAGTLKIGETVKLMYVDQSRDALDADKTVYDEISRGQEVIVVGKTEVPARRYCGFFNFKGSDQQKKVGVLSGGERNRVHLAKTLTQGGNVLLLDEPTNDLDVETLRSLEAALLEWPGCALITSHDRWFLDRIATHILAFEGDSRVVFFEGTYDEYEADRKRRLGAEAERPHRIKYRKLTKN